MHRSAGKALLAVLSFLVLSPDGRAQVNLIFARPDSTEAGIQVIHGEHLACWSGSVPSRHRLVLMIEGTGSAARDILPFDTLIASMGYAVISLDYPNNVVTTICSNSTDSSCFYGFRQEIIFGTPVSPVVQVDSINCIYNRLRQFLLYLAARYPDQGWKEFIKDSVIQWENIIAAGHSQGAGHAAYLGKKFRLAKVLIFSGPQDYLSYYQTPAGWLSDSGQTDPSRYFAFLHVRDPYDFRKQLINCSTLMGRRPADTVVIKLADTTMVRPGLPVIGGRHILVTDIESSNPHGSVLQPEFRKVWEYMLLGDEADRW
jgi:hypothetical protein